MYDTNNNGLCLSRLSEDCEANALENQESFHFNARHVMHVMSMIHTTSYLTMALMSSVFLFTDQYQFEKHFPLS